MYFRKPALKNVRKNSDLAEDCLENNVDKSLWIIAISLLI